MNSSTTARTFNVAPVEPAKRPVNEWPVVEALDSLLLPPVKDAVRISREINRWEPDKPDAGNEQSNMFVRKRVSNLKSQLGGEYPKYCVNP